MLVNELPDDCLLAIFDHLNHLDDLINCFKVCIKWSYLVAKRTKKVKYLLHHFTRDSSHYVHYKGEGPIDGTCLTTLFPNLIIADFGINTFSKRVKSEDFVALVKSQKSLKGLMHYGHSESLSKYCDNLEMLFSDVIDPHIKKNGSSVKQLNLWKYTLADFKRDAHCFPNLERLHIHSNQDSLDNYYNGPVMEKLKIFELSVRYDHTDIYCFQFMDSCPNLQSAHIVLNSDRLFFDESFKHKSLQDLVLQCYWNVRYDWNIFKRLFMKYPNLKHLALWSNPDLKNEHIKQLVHSLPNLVLLDVGGCDKVTQRAADYVRYYCKLYGRSIKFYFRGNRNDIASDWPQLSNKWEIISPGFDFMKHCFLKEFYQLSVFLIPIDC